MISVPRIRTKYRYFFFLCSLPYFAHLIFYPYIVLKNKEFLAFIELLSKGYLPVLQHPIIHVPPHTILCLVSNALRDQGNTDMLIITQIRMAICNVRFQMNAV